MPFIDHQPPPPPPCRHPEHDPPGMIVLKPGTHTWECPGCKQTQVVVKREATLLA